MNNEMQLIDDSKEPLPVAQNSAPQQALSSYDNMLMIAVQSGNIDTIERMMALKERHEANEARKAFTAAKSAFKGEAVVVVKDKFNSQYKSMYSSLGNLVTTVNPYLSKHGLSADWDIKQSGASITVTAILSHSMGHSERVEFTVPVDKAGAKNDIQAIKSSVTYAKAVTYESVCGMASTDANVDDDGKGSSQPKQEKPAAKEKLVGPRFDQALAAVRAGKYNAAEMRGYYDLTPDQDAALRDVEKETAK